MGKTISAFFQFVIEDPIMLGLVIAIVVLIILFIVVLSLGKKVDKTLKDKETDEKLMKTEVDLSVLSEMDETKPSGQANSVQDVVTPPAEDVTPVPVTVETAPTKVEIPSVQEPIETFTEPKVDTFAMESSVPSFDDFRIEVPTEEEMKEITGELNIFDQLNTPKESEVPVIPEVKPVTPSMDEQLANLTVEETPIEPQSFEPQPEVVMPIANEEPKVEDVASVVEPEPIAKAESSDFDMSDYIFEPIPDIVESAVNPVDEENSDVEVPKVEIAASEPQVENAIHEEMATGPVLEAVPTIEEQQETLTDVYGYEDVELPEIKVDDFSRTTIIRHIPTLDMGMKSIFEDDNSSEMDDLDLPKLNSSTSSATGLNALHGESFDIPKNS